MTRFDDDWWKRPPSPDFNAYVADAVEDPIRLGFPVVTRGLYQLCGGDQVKYMGLLKMMEAAFVVGRHVGRKDPR